MKFRDYFTIPQNLAGLPLGTLDAINLEASERGGVVSFYITVPLRYPQPNGKYAWKNVWQLLDYNINTDSIARLYPYRMGRKGQDMPLPDTDKPYFTQDHLPKSARKMLRDKVKYYKTGAKQI